MDPLTHTLVGASLAATRLGTKTTYASAALVVGANLPDVDVLSYAWGEDAALEFRRGWTHGIPALIVLPALLALGVWLWARWRAPKSAARSPSAGWLVLLSYLAVFTHPALDWLNTYGMRWLMPFDGGWFYGDAVFIMDPWLWLVLGVGWLLGKEPRPGLFIGWLIFALMTVATVVALAPNFLPLVGLVAGVLLAALSWRPTGSPGGSRRWATLGLLLAAAYITALLALHEQAEAKVLEAMTGGGQKPPARLMVGPVPADPLTWDVVATRGRRIEHGRFSWRAGRGLSAGRLELSEEAFEQAELEPVWQEIEAVPGISGFLGWARFPWIEVGPEVNGARRVSVMDARYVREVGTGFGTARVVLPAR